MRCRLPRSVALAGREGRIALAALFGLGCAGDIWYLDPAILPRNQVVLAPRDHSVRSPPRGLVQRGCGQASEALRHRVAPGETLSDLARWYGLPVTALARANGMHDPDQLAADSWVRIPPGARTGCAPTVPLVRALPPSQPDGEAAQPRTRPSQPRTESAGEAETSLPAARRLLGRAQSSYDAADFEASLQLAKSSLHLLGSEAEGPETVRMRARAAWIAGLSYTALGQRGPAVASFRAALDQDPSLADQQTLSPKVRFLVDSARVASAPTR